MANSKAVQNKRKPTEKQLDTICKKEHELCILLERQEYKDRNNDRWSAKTMNFRERIEKARNKIFKYREAINDDSKYDDMLIEWVHMWGSHND